jgi:hypothetical protein
LLPTSGYVLAAERARLRQEASEAEILRRIDELRRAVLNAVSHDLRTPLATIVASAGSLEQEDVAWTEEERHDFAHAIVEEAQRLNRIVGNLLDLSRIEAGALRPEKGWYDLSLLVEEVLGLGPLAQTMRSPISRLGHQDYDSALTRPCHVEAVARRDRQAGVRTTALCPTSLLPTWHPATPYGSGCRHYSANLDQLVVIGQRTPAQ